MRSWLLRGIGVATFTVCSVLSLAADAQSATKEKVNAALPKLDAYIDGLIKNDAVPGLSVAVDFEDEVVYLSFPKIISGSQVVRP